LLRIDFAAGHQILDHARIQKTSKQRHRLRAACFFDQVSRQRRQPEINPAPDQRHRQRPVLQLRQPKAERRPARQRSQQHHPGQFDRIDATRETQIQESPQSQRQQGEATARRPAQPVAVFEVVDGRGQNIDAGINLAHHRGAQVLQTRRGRADHHDLAGEFILRALRLFAIEVEIQVGKADVTTRRMPVQAKLVSLRLRPAEIARQPRRQRRQTPTSDFAVDQIVPADAIAIHVEIDQAAAPGLGRQRQRQQQGRARIRFGRSGALQAQHRRQRRQRRTDAVAQQDRGLIHMAMREQDFAIRRIAVGAEGIGFVGEHVEHNGLRLLPSQPVDQLAQHHARPRPAAGDRVHFFQTLLVDVDHHDVGRGWMLARLLPQHQIAHALVNDAAKIQPAVIGQRRQRQREQQRRISMFAQEIHRDTGLGKTLFYRRCLQRGKGPRPARTQVSDPKAANRAGQIISQRRKFG